MALINCPECNNKISDKATVCIHCGCPKEFFNADTSISMPKVEKSVKKANTKRKHMRLPNGYGYIQHLSGKRRNPYVAYEPINKAQYSDDGKPPKRKALGTFPTYNKALECLTNWHNTHGVSTNGVLSFKDVYYKMMESFENDTSEKALSDSTLNGHRTSFKNYCKELHDIPMDKIYKESMQIILDNCDKGYSTHMNIKKFFNAMFKYSIENGIVEKDYAKFVHVKKQNDNKSGEPFTLDQVKELWNHADDYNVQIILILLYTGMRIGELKVTKINFKEKIFEGGLKTPFGQKRIIPIPDCIYTFVENFDQKNFKPKEWRDKIFHPLMKELNMNMSTNGERHTPHDLRHTFSWLWDSYRDENGNSLDMLSKYMIIGHKPPNADVDMLTYGHRTLEQLSENINKLESFHT